MVNAGILIGWKEPKVGREPLAAELWGASLAFYQAKVADGTLESFEPAIIASHGGDLNGFFLLRGRAEKLDAFRRSEAFVDWTVKAVHCLDGFGVVDAYLGEGLQQIMQKWATTIPR
jgi:hypothetical protein